MIPADTDGIELQLLHRRRRDVEPSAAQALLIGARPSTP